MENNSNYQSTVKQISAHNYIINHFMRYFISQALATPHGSISKFLCGSFVQKLHLKLTYESNLLFCWARDLHHISLSGNSVFLLATIKYLSHDNCIMRQYVEKGRDILTVSDLPKENLIHFLIWSFCTYCFNLNPTICSWIWRCFNRYDN